MDLIAAKPSFEMLDYLLKRRSLKVGEFVEPGPDAEQLQTLLTAAARVPDRSAFLALAGFLAAGFWAASFWAGAFLAADFFVFISFSSAIIQLL